MARHQQERIPGFDKYGTQMFYSGGNQELSTSRYSNNFGATYSNGQARPVFAPAAPKPAAPVRPLPAPQLQQLSYLGNDTSRQDKIVLSRELQEEHGNASWSAPKAEVQPVRPAGNETGPAYSADVLRALDSVLNGRAALV